jgi:signal transduction histidine kinase
VPPELGESIFRSLVTTKPKGMGIGLYVCHAIVTAHGGRIWAEAGAEGGAVFKFTLPLLP